MTLWIVPTRLLCPWNSSVKNTGVGCHFLLQGSSPPRDQTQVSCTAGRFYTVWATAFILTEHSRYIVNSCNQLIIKEQPSLVVECWTLLCCYFCKPTSGEIYLNRSHLLFLVLTKICFTSWKHAFEVWLLHLVEGIQHVILMLTEWFQ